jgi:hypothetical protein|nr:MAG TPA: hypothetical protein [Caudoviricetes sp.]
MNNVNRFYSIIEEKQSNYKNVFEFLRTFISNEKEVSYIGSRIRIDKKMGAITSREYNDSVSACI